MYQQTQQIEKLHLATIPRELEQEVQQIRRVRLAESTLKYNSPLNRLLTSLGSRLITMGSWLTERYGNLMETESAPEHTKPQAAGLV